MGLLGSMVISVVSTVLAFQHVEDRPAKAISALVTALYGLGLILMFVWGFMKPPNRKKYGQPLYFGMVSVFGATVISDIIGFVWWEDIELDSLWEYSKGLTIAQFAITMIGSVGLSVCCFFFPKCLNQEQAAKEVEVKAKTETVSKTGGDESSMEPGGNSQNNSHQSGETAGMVGAGQAPIIQPQVSGPTPTAIPEVETQPQVIDEEAPTKD